MGGEFMHHPGFPDSPRDESRKGVCAMARRRQWGVLLCCFGALVMACASAQTPPVETPNAGIPQNVVIVTVWPGQPLDALNAAYQQELGVLMEALGVGHQFASLEEATTQAFPGRIVLLRMLEASPAREARSQLHQLPRGALAWTHASGPDVTPFGAVDLAALRAFLGMDDAEAESADILRLQGVAIARVVAHEVFHMLTRSKVHSYQGLMKPGLSRDELLAERAPTWTSRNRDEVRQRLRPRPTTVLAAVSGEQPKAAGNR